MQDRLPLDEARGFVAERERSDVVHDLLAFLAERMLEMANDHKLTQEELITDEEMAFDEERF